MMNQLKFFSIFYSVECTDFHFKLQFVVIKIVRALYEKQLLKTISTQKPAHGYL